MAEQEQEQGEGILTDLEVRKTRPPAKGRLNLTDGKVDGLSLRITAAGARTWSLLYRAAGLQRRLTLGAYRTNEQAAGSGFTIAEARAEARRRLREVGQGADPQGEKVQAKVEAKREGLSFADVCRKFLVSPSAPKRGRPWRKKTRDEYTRLIENEIIPALGERDPEAIGKREIRAFYDRTEKRSEAVAKHILVLMRRLFAWAVEEDYLEIAPPFPQRSTQSNRRSRALDPAEMRLVSGAIEGGLVVARKDDGKKRPAPRSGAKGRKKLERKKREAAPAVAMAEAFRLLLITAQRRGDVLGARWAEFTEEPDGAWWTIPGERHKSKLDHRVPLSGLAVEALKRLHAITGSSEWLLPSPRANAKTPHVSNPQKAAERLWKSSGVKGAWIHDLRRTAITNMARMGIDYQLRKRIVGQIETDVHGRYDVHAYDREKRAALERWADELSRILEGGEAEEKAAGKVLPWAKR